MEEKVKARGSSGELHWLSLPRLVGMTLWDPEIKVGCISPAMKPNLSIECIHWSYLSFQLVGIVLLALLIMFNNDKWLKLKLESIATRGVLGLVRDASIGILSSDS